MKRSYATKKFLPSALFGILIGLALSIPYALSATRVDYNAVGQQFGWRDSNEFSDMSLYYLDGSTTVSLTLKESKNTNYDWIDIMYETASDVWTKQTANITLKDNDANGYIDTLSFTAAGGATAGGEVRIRGVAIDDATFPGI